MNPILDRRTLDHLLPAREVDQALLRHARVLLGRRPEAFDRAAEFIRGDRPQIDLYAAGVSVEAFIKMTPGEVADLARRERLRRAEALAVNRAEVCLLVVRCGGFPNCDEKTGRLGANWTWHVLDRGLLAWLTDDVYCALTRWVEEQADLTQALVARFLDRLEELAASRTAAGIVRAVAAVLGRLAEAPASFAGRGVESLRRVLSAGGQTATHVALN